MSHTSYTAKFQVIAWRRLAEESDHSAIYDSPARQPFPLCFEGTRIHLLETLHDTIHHHPRKLIWLTGNAGSGKSAVAYTFAQQLQNSGARVATFFSSRQHPISRVANRFLPTISYQLGLMHPRAKEAITKAIVDDPALFSPDRSRRDQFVHLILEPLKSMRHCFNNDATRMVIILDISDRDEALNDERHVFLSLVNLFIEAIRQEGFLNFLNIVMTSRPYAFMNRVARRSPVILPLDMADFDAQADIALLLRSFFEDIAHTQHPILPPVAPSELEIQSLSVKIGPQFAVAAALVDLFEERQLYELRALLDTFSKTQEIPVDNIRVVAKGNRPSGGTPAARALPTPTIREVLISLAS
ncbi:hypothetical protein CONPUDRAFT_157488 [Coniophora puteana RWD-64-598 SS2]|uniref:Nephrocystin 3-like N-terminal domain-containing protein n=1 Tax=Coniophora puteana (strain RWD-64-598) TaxID=741705 RepID=A0A5M3MEK0_CONPW|nr:uncharacterized protein CONPUDRAFT_157488 [Coniophora puteana RWD-64-598 SS2]EIW77224.1 hypothetical protein CONPUDRAFT_157488 [Coniophora puteana RWD-64-598 SS2]